MLKVCRTQGCSPRAPRDSRDLADFFCDFSFLSCHWHVAVSNPSERCLLINVKILCQNGGFNLIIDAPNPDLVVKHIIMPQIIGRWVEAVNTQLLFWFRMESHLSTNMPNISQNLPYGTFHLDKSVCYFKVYRCGFVWEMQTHSIHWLIMIVPIKATCRCIVYPMYRQKSSKIHVS